MALIALALHEATAIVMLFTMRHTAVLALPRWHTRGERGMTGS